MARILTDRRAMLALICGAIAAGAASASVRAPDALRQLIHDPQTGLALHGYDPVAYHSEGRAVAGKQSIEAEAAGFAWRFGSFANRAAFLANLEAYLPHFGGHDASAVGDGRMIEGNPAIYLMFGERPAFFRTAGNRDAFARDEALRRKAVARWPEVARQFAGH
jgi:hypothetical protein